MGPSALIIAIINGHYDTAAMLTEKGADPNLADTAGMAALYATVDMNTLGEVYGRPARPPTDKLTALDLMKILLDARREPERAAENAHAAAGSHTRRASRWAKARRH